jgi:hypothetical protein
MRHAIFRLAVAVSLGLFAMICFLWNGSYKAQYERTYITPIGQRHRYFYILSQSGEVVVKSTPDWPTGPTGDREADWASCRATECLDQPFARERRCRRVGSFRAISGEDEFYDDSGGTLIKPGLAVSFPYAALMLPFLLLPLAVARSALRRRWRRRHTLCVRCGYDLRCSPSRCPECGIPR